MLDFVSNAFRPVFKISLWLMFFIITIYCFILFGGMFGGGGFHIGFAFLGLIIGGIVSLIIMILYGGIIANFLIMVDDINSIKCYLSKNTSSGSSSEINLSNVQPIGSTVINAADSWVCKKCNEKNSNNSTSCKSCGAYK